MSETTTCGSCGWRWVEESLCKHPLSFSFDGGYTPASNRKATTRCAMRSTGESRRIKGIPREAANKACPFFESPADTFRAVNESINDLNERMKDQVMHITKARLNDK